MIRLRPPKPHRRRIVVEAARRKLKVKSPTLETLQAKALKLLSFRPRSVAELKFRLGRYRADPALIDQVINQFLDQGLIDDNQFAAWWVEQRCRFRPKGNRVLQSELMQKGIARDIIAANLLSLSQEKTLAKNLMIAKGITDKETVFSRLASRGFSTDTIAAVIDELDQKE